MKMLVICMYWYQIEKINYLFLGFRHCAYKQYNIPQSPVQYHYHYLINQMLTKVRAFVLLPIFPIYVSPWTKFLFALTAWALSWNEIEQLQSGVHGRFCFQTHQEHAWQKMAKTDRWRRMQANFKSLCLCRKWKKRYCLRPGDTKLDCWVSTSIATTLGLPKGDKTSAST